ncbi:MAG: flavoprotein [Phycisphaerales bacterium]
MSNTGQGKRVLVAVTGGIAAYKTCTLVSRLTQAGCDVTVLMTQAAQRFVTPLTFEALSGHAVHTSLWRQLGDHESQHIALARNAHLLVIAPASANTLAKLAHGIADNVVTTVALAMPRSPAAVPVLLAPAMNADMWANPLVQRNLAILRDELGWHTVGPDTGWQACRTSGPGRMAEPDAVLEQAVTLLR